MDVLPIVSVAITSLVAIGIAILGWFLTHLRADLHELRQAVEKSRAESNANVQRHEDNLRAELQTLATALHATAEKATEASTLIRMHGENRTDRDALLNSMIERVTRIETLTGNLYNSLGELRRTLDPDKYPQQRTETGAKNKRR